MSNKKLLQDYVEARTFAEGSYPEIVKLGIDTISGEVPFKLKLAIVLSELITFTSHLRKPIRLYDGTLVPTNAIVFALSASGTSKDKSLNAIRKALKGGYDTIELERKSLAREAARRKADEATGNSDNWAQFYNAPKPLQAGLGTVEGLVQHFSEIAANPIGAGSISTSEIGSELQTNSNMPEIIKAISVAYDLGNIPAKIVKSSENQTSAVTNLPVNALFFGSQEALLFNNEIKGKFKLAFNTQLARRSIFSFTPESPGCVSYSSIEELCEYREKERVRVLEAQKKVAEYTDTLLKEVTTTPLAISEEANKLFDVYLELNTIRSEEISNKFPISKLSQKHKQWLALKLSGTYAILDRSNTVEERHYALAINTVEILAPDLQAFEKELVKEPYEQLVDMCKYSAEDKEFFISLHELKKLSYINGSGSSKAKVDELVVMANSYDETGMYTASSEGIHYKEVVKTDVVGVSYLIFDTDKKDEEFKEYAQDKCSKGYQFYETQFDEITLLLQENATYSPFSFVDGVRHKDNVTGGAKFIILDVDKTFLTNEEAHVLLNQYNHHIVLTSDPENVFKYRILLEFDSLVDVDDFTWKALISVVAEDLGLVVDVLPKSQIFFSFAGRTVLTQLEGETLDSKRLIERARDIVKEKPLPVSSLPQKARQQRLEDPRETFAFAFTAEKGERSVKMYRALAFAIDLGANEEYLTNLANEINDYWIVPIEKERLYKTLLNPAIRRLKG